jgi:hypothetical protein
MNARYSIPKSFIKYPSKVAYSCLQSSQIYHNKRKLDMTMNIKDDNLYVCFKGCSVLKDFLRSIDIRSCNIHGETLGIHNGYCENFKIVQDNLIKDILTHCEKGDIKNIIFTGHSAGAAIAQISCLFLYDSIKDDSIKQHCYLFGSPKVGDMFFKDALECILEERLLRVETFNDIVCLLPTQSSFIHAGDCFIMYNNKIFNELNSIPKSDISKIEGLEFYLNYYSNHVEFIKRMNSNNILNKKELQKMIDNHAINVYLNNVNNIFQPI